MVESNSSQFHKHALYVFVPVMLLLSGVLCTLFVESKVTLTIIGLFLIPSGIHLFGWYLIHKDVDDNMRSHPKEEDNKEVKPVKDEGEIKPQKYEEDRTKYKKRLEGAEWFCSFYNITMFFSVLFYGLGWLFFIFASEYSKLFLKWLSLACFGLIMVQVLISAFIAYLIMGNRQEHKFRWMSKLKFGLAIFPFWRFTHFFAIFMSTTFLFGFAFAFHDLEIRSAGENKSALVIENLDFDEFPTVKNKPQPKKISLVKRVCFYFESGRANYIDKDDDSYSDSTLRKLSSKHPYFIKKENSKQMDIMVKSISKIQTGALGIPRITLIGRADDRQSGNVYPSNYQLSEARINNVKSSITGAFYEANGNIWQDIDWIEVPLSNEFVDDSTLIKKESITKRDKSVAAVDKSKHKEKKLGGIQRTCPALEDNEDSERRIVEALITNVKYNDEKKFMKTLKTDFDNKLKDTPRLIDYIYFPISKGYGDMKPATSYAKFLDSLENFFEVFFLVCFLSALISYKHESIDIL